MSAYGGVLFDIGGVLVTDGPRMDVVAASLGLGPDSLDTVDSAMWEARDAYDLGIPDSEYWERVAELAGAAPPSPQVISELTTSDVTRWHTPRVEVVGLMTQLASAGLRLGVLSNAPFALARSFASQEWTQILHSLTFSCEVGCAKPDRRIYEAAAVAMGLEPAEILFFDDRATNVVGAKEVGMGGELWVDEPTGRRALRLCGLLA